MIEGMEALRASGDRTGLAELRSLLEELMGESSIDARLLSAEKLLRSRVFRLRIEAGTEVNSFVAKRFSPGRALREQRAIRRWLPQVGLGASGPCLLGTAAERTGHLVWHVYEDLGDCALSRTPSDAAKVREAVNLVARLHTRFADHPLLSECRAAGSDLGAYGYRSRVRDALRSLELLLPPAFELAQHERALIDRLRERIQRLHDEAPERTAALAEFGGPETFLHGDLQTTNILVLPGAQGLDVRLIDWDHAGVGPVSYDLSTLLARFPVEERTRMLDIYREAVRPVGWHLPGLRELNLLFDTAACARLARCVSTRTIDLSERPSETAFGELASVDEWFRKLEPLLPVGEEAAAV